MVGGNENVFVDQGCCIGFVGIEVDLFDDVLWELGCVYEDVVIMFEEVVIDVYGVFVFEIVCVVCVVFVVVIIDVGFIVNVIESGFIIVIVEV